MSDKQNKIELDLNEVYCSVTEAVSDALPSLTDREMSEAISSGVENALPAFSGIEITEAIKEGVESAFWRLFTNATDAPCQDFYEAVTNGIAKGIEEAASKGYLDK